MSIATIQSYLEALEDYVHEQVSNAATESMPVIHEALHRFSVDVSRFGFQVPEIYIPSLGDFQVPLPPPPPPPPSKSFWEKSVDCVYDHPWTASSICAGIISVGLFVGYTTARGGVSTRLRAAGRAGASSSERRRVVVVLGGDTPLAFPLILDLEKKGFIVVASVATPEAADELEGRCNGYVRALVLDPVEPATVPIFLRSLASTLSRRFPINASGDPHSNPATHPYIHSIISLLTLPSPYAPPPAPLEHLHLQGSYLPYLNATHVTPLQVIQALLPLLRSSPARARDIVSNGEKKSIIVCIPAAESRIGLPFAAANAMSAAATLRGIEVLRREINMATLTGDYQTSMGNIKVFVVDVGAVEPPQMTTRRLLTYDATHAMDTWTPSEKLAYGAAYQSILEDGNAYQVAREPTDARVFVESIVDVVSYGRRKTWSVFGVTLGLGPIVGWLSGERFGIGAGSSTYAIASYLPTSLLNIILNVPHFLLSLRNALVHAPPHVVMPPRSATSIPARPVSNPLSGTAPASVSSIAGASEKQVGKGAGPASASVSEQEQEHDVSSEAGSEADVESNAGEGLNMGESWVSLQPGSIHTVSTMSSQASSVTGDA